MANKNIQDIEGIGPKFGEVLREAGIKNTEALLSAGATRAGRKELAARTGINEKLILKWVNMCDLFRIKGVASQYAELLECAGVDTVKELRARRPDNLTERMAEVNAQKRLVRQTPGVNLVTDWVEQAKTLPPLVSY